MHNWTTLLYSRNSHNTVNQLYFNQFSSVAQLCLTLCDPVNHSTPGLPVHHHLPECTQTYVHRVSDAIQPSHPLSSPSPPAPSPSQHQSLFQWVNSSHEVAKKSLLHNLHHWLLPIMLIQKQTLTFMDRTESALSLGQQRPWLVCSEQFEAVKNWRGFQEDKKWVTIFLSKRESKYASTKRRWWQRYASDKSFLYHEWILISFSNKNINVP